MARDFRLPDIGEGLTEAEIVRWLVAVGDEVQADQPIVEVETDKAVVEIPTPYAGTVISLGGSEGDVVAVGSVLVTIGAAEELEGPGAEPAADQTGTGAPSDPEPIVGTLGGEVETLSARPSPGQGLPVPVQALPIVRKLARDNEVDLTSIEGSGPGGRITREDVETAIAARAGSAPTSPPMTPAPPVTVAPPEVVPAHHQGPEHAVHDVAVGAGHGVSDEHLGLAEPKAPSMPPGEERRPISRLRRTISANMAKSWAEIPHVTTFDDVDATRLLEVRKALGERHGAKIPLEALVVKAVLPALDQFPEFNASLEGDDLVLHAGRDIGIAVDTPDGLLVAVIRGAEQKSVMELADEVRRLGEGAKARSLTPAELSGQTFTVSNIGAVGGGHGTPIVPYGTIAILSVGMARPRPVVSGQDIAVAPVMPLSLSYDHRVIDGAVGRRFMTLVLENLAEPALFLAG
ncbi:MAG TPA: dihydrolipoamide acetyltransferase family protein [Acidimicrobiia bacterium]|nr:dihydrolipoamide acetyltransferase family protein [Acidimicrobiia bacterium]